MITSVLLKNKRRVFLLSLAVFLVTIASSRIVCDFSFFHQLQYLIALSSLSILALFIFIFSFRISKKRIKDPALRWFLWIPTSVFTGICYVLFLLMLSNRFEDRFAPSSADLPIAGGRVHAEIRSGWRDITEVYFEKPLFGPFYYVREICWGAGAYDDVPYHFLKENTILCEGHDGKKEIKL